MKKLIFGLSALMLIFLSSCERCADCECVGSWQYEFDPQISNEDEAFYRSVYDAEFTTDFQRQEEQICETGGNNLEEAMTDYEEQNTQVIEDGGTIDGEPWSVAGLFDCNCVEE